jgi:hypothetical protein
MSISSVIFMNVLNTFDNPEPSFLNLAGFGGWFGLMWAVNARDEVPLLRLFAPVVGALAMLGINNVLLVCFAILTFVIRAMFHPIPLSLGILTLSALSSIVYLKKQLRQQIRESLDEAFRYSPPAVAAEQEAIDNLNNQEGHQELALSEDEEVSDDGATHDELNNAMLDEEEEEEEQAQDDDTVVSEAQNDNQTVQSEDEENVIMAPVQQLPISPPDSPVGFPTPQTALYVIEPVPQFELVPAGGAGDVYPVSESPNPHA